MSIFKIDNLCYFYDSSNNYVLKNINYEFEKSKIYAITGKSGSGKTTLLSLMAGLDTPKSGKILYNLEDISKINKEEYRSKKVGVIFQSFNLLYHLTAIENIILSMDISGSNIKNKNEKALELLNEVGIDNVTANRKILRLSGGEMQRISIARALSFDPEVILADEPTGSLDKDNEEQVMNIFKYLAHKKEKCVIIVTHSKNVCDCADEIYNLETCK